MPRGDKSYALFWIQVALFNITVIVEKFAELAPPSISSIGVFFALLRDHLFSKLGPRAHGKRPAHICVPIETKCGQLVLAQFFHFDLSKCPIVVPNLDLLFALWKVAAKLCTLTQLLPYQGFRTHFDLIIYTL